MTDTAELERRLSEATEGSRELDSAVFAACGMDINPNPASFEYGHWPEETAVFGTAFYRIDRVTTSIDDARDLVERKLPGWAGDLDVLRPFYARYGFRLFSPHNVFPEEWNANHDAEAATPPLAICLCLIRALATNPQEPTP